MALLHLVTLPVRLTERLVLAQRIPGGRHRPVLEA
jgi:hypothetical protein